MTFRTEDFMAVAERAGMDMELFDRLPQSIRTFMAEMICPPPTAYVYQDLAQGYSLNTILIKLQVANEAERKKHYDGIGAGASGHADGQSSQAGQLHR